MSVSGERSGVWTALRNIMILAAAIGAIAGGRAAQATEITFDSLTSASLLSGPYDEQGYRFSSAQGFVTNANSFFDADTSPTSATLGDTCCGGNWTTLSKIGGGAFDLGGIDFALQYNFYDHSVPTTGINFIFNFAAGGQSTTSMFINDLFSGGVPTLQTLSFNLPALSSVSWQSSNYVQWDNVKVSATPIPATLPLLASALGGLGFVAWRRKKHRADL